MKETTHLTVSSAGGTHRHVCTRCNGAYWHHPGTAVPLSYPKDSATYALLAWDHSMHGTCTRCLDKMGRDIRTIDTLEAILDAFVRNAAGSLETILTEIFDPTPTKTERPS